MSLNTTGFSIGPNDEAVSVDPNKPKELTEVNLSTSLSQTSTTNLGLDEKQLKAIEEDPAVQKRLIETNQTTEQYLTSVSKELPPGTTISYFADEVSPADMERDLSRIKRADPDKFAKAKPSFIKSAMVFTGKMTKLAKVLDIKNKIDFEIIDGLDIEDLTTEGGLALAAIEEALKLYSKANIWKYIPSTGIDKLQDYIIKFAMELTGKYGSYEGAAAIIRKYPRSINSKLRRKTVTEILKNYRINDEDLGKGSFTVAKRVVDHLNYISPGWDTIERNNDIVKYHNPWIVANDGALNILRYDNRTRSAAAIQMDNRYSVESYQLLANKYLPKYPSA